MTVQHPAKFTDSILEIIGDVLRGRHEELGREIEVLDPFAGTGKIHLLNEPGKIRTHGIEIEPEWAEMHPRTLVGDATNLPFRAEVFDVIATSPTYGNRMSDHHDAKDDSVRVTYRHKLGRPLHENNSGRMPWGENYRDLHHFAWVEATRVLSRDGMFILNAKNFYRTRTVKKKRVRQTVDVVGWHHDHITSLGFSTIADIAVPVRGMGFGQNGKQRISHERVIVMRKKQRR